MALATGLGVVAGAIALRAVSKDASAAPSVRRRAPRSLRHCGLSPVNLSAGIGEQDERPLDTAQLERSYEFGIGDFTVDLNEVALPPGTTKVDVELGIGNLLVRVPEDAALEIGAHADGGQVTVLGETDDGQTPRARGRPGTTPDAPTLEFDADIGFGHLAVLRG